MSDSMKFVHISEREKKARSMMEYHRSSLFNIEKKRKKKEIVKILMSSSPSDLASKSYCSRDLRRRWQCCCEFVALCQSYKLAVEIILTDYYTKSYHKMKRLVMNLI